MFFDGNVDAPKILGTSSPQKVATAVIKALKKGSCEIIVNAGPIRPLLALGQISWKLADIITRLFVVSALSRMLISVYLLLSVLFLIFYFSTILLNDY